MNYRTLAGERVSQLGVGAMRLPTQNGKIDEPRAIEMIRFAIDNGVNYMDTAWPYHREESEPLVGKALRNGYRERTFVATKSPIWLIEEESDFERILDQQLLRLETEQVDFYLLHALNKKHWETCRKCNALGFLKRMQEKGKVRHLGFSFHDELALFKEILDAFKWEFCQIQYNYLDREYQAGEEGLDYARSKNVDVIVMEPLRGGNLAGPIPGKVQTLWEKSGTAWTPVEWALRWIWNDPLVSLVLSGMSSLEQLKENIDIASTAAAGQLRQEQLLLVDQARTAYRSLIQVDCTGCGYCMPCPSGVDIPRNFSLWNEYHMFDRPERANQYRSIDAGARAEACTECGLCLSHCPQEIAIPEELRRVAAELAAQA